MEEVQGRVTRCWHAWRNLPARAVGFTPKAAAAGSVWVSDGDGPVSRLSETSETRSTPSGENEKKNYGAPGKSFVTEARSEATTPKRELVGRQRSRRPLAQEQRSANAASERRKSGRGRSSDKALLTMTNHP